MMAFTPGVDAIEELPSDRPLGIDAVFVHEYAGLARLAYLLTGDRYLAEDLVQEAFVRVAGRFRHLRDAGAFEGYLRRTVVNLFTSQLRRRRVERAYLEEYRRSLEALVQQAPARSVAVETRTAVDEVGRSRRPGS